MSIRRHMPRWLRRLELFCRRLLRLNMIGEIDGRVIVPPARISDPRYGRSSRYPSVLEIRVLDEEQHPLDIGRRVNELFFEDFPPIIFNVCFSCGRPGLFTPGVYADPESIWFNVFFGYYEIDVPADRWDRPFGFEDADATRPCFDDLLRIGKSDWNYFSNYLYGVPGECIAPYNQVRDEGLETRVLPGTVKIGDREFVRSEVDGMRVVSGYESGQDGQRLVDNDWFLSPIWRAVFGHPRRRPEHVTSFVPTRMKMRFMMRAEGPSYDIDLDRDAYKTFIYGGSVNLDYEGELDNDEFMELQMEAVKKVVYDKTKGR